MAVGLPAKTTYADGDVFSASDINDTNGTLNLVGQTNNFYAGKNKIINGDFGVWQRGTSFTLGLTNPAYVADRFQVGFNIVPTNVTVTRQTATPGELVIPGYGDAKYYQKITSTTVGSMTVMTLATQIEDVQTFAGQTVTFSFYAKADSNRSLTGGILRQNFGSGGSTSVNVSLASANLTTSWQRFTSTITLGSISGKTIGANNHLLIRYDLPVANGAVIDTFGWQVEAGSTATAFQTATGTIQGELAACQRYYYRSSNNSNYSTYGTGFSWGTTTCNSYIKLPVSMRVVPTSFDYSNVIFQDSSFSGAGTQTITLATAQSNSDVATVETANATGLTANRVVYLRNNNNANGYVGFSAEL
jgi:hypothetical protein